MKTLRASVKCVSMTPQQQHRQDLQVKWLEAAIALQHKDVTQTLQLDSFTLPKASKPTTDAQPGA